MTVPAQPTTNDTFTALIACFNTDLAALTGEEAPQSITPTDFIGLVERARDILIDARVSRLKDAREALDRAVSRLTDALTNSGNDQRSLLARARMYLRAATEATR
ncbi:hypothetical protein [Streptomyces sp. NPDC002172]